MNAETMKKNLDLHRKWINDMNHTHPKKGIVMKKIIGMFIDIKTAIGMLFEIEREHRKSMYATSKRDALPTEAGL